MVSFFCKKRGRYWTSVGVFLTLFSLWLILPNMLADLVYYKNGEISSSEYFSRQLTGFIFCGLLLISGVVMILGKLWGGILAQVIITLHCMLAIFLFFSIAFGGSNSLYSLIPLCYLLFCIWLVYLINIKRKQTEN